MPLSIDDAIEVLSLLSKEENLTVAVHESLKGGLMAGTLTVVGGLLGGPVGLAMGGAIGGCIAASTCKSFKPVPEILMEMKPHERKELAQRFMDIFRNVDANDVATVMMLLAGQTALKNLALKMITDYITNEMKLKLSQ